MKEAYFDIAMAIERLHHLFMEVVRIELDRLDVRDLTNIQGFLLYNIGEKVLTVGEASSRGYYLGSNVTYTLKKMIENDYLIQTDAPYDGRSSLISLSEKGIKLYKKLDQVFAAHAKNMASSHLTEEELKEMKGLLQRLESFWKFVLAHDVNF